MSKINVFIVDSFTSEQFKGNPAGVVLYGNDLSAEYMQKIAQEINLSETVFAIKTDNSDRLVVRYFTRTQEIDFCGHATLALAWILGKKAKLTKLTLATNVGEVLIFGEYEENELKRVFMKQVAPQVKAFTGNNLELNRILGLEETDIDKRYPIKLAYTGNWDIFIPLINFQIIEKVNPNIAKLKEHNKYHQISSTHLFTFTDKYIVTRNFSPAVGIDEDPVTGSSTGALIGYLLFENFLKFENQNIDVMQINSLNRPGLINVKIVVEKDNLAIYVGGSAVCVLEGNLFLK